MKARLPRTLCVLLFLVLTTSLTAREGVRAELSRLQKETGLTLAWYYVGVHTAGFSDRSASTDKPNLPMENPYNGLLGPDGSEIAFPASGPDPRQSLTTVWLDGTIIAQYREFVDVTAVCWSPDKSKLVIHAKTSDTRPPQYGLLILDLASHAVKAFGDNHSSTTAQCWSPDGQKIVYGSGDTMRIYDVSSNQSRVIAQGSEPTWSPDGQWIAFSREDGYYSTSPAGGEAKRLFKTKQGRSALFWSPDSGIVAYFGTGGTFMETLRYIDVGLIQLRVRRLSDGSEDWIWQTPDVPPAWSLSCVWHHGAKNPTGRP